MARAAEVPRHVPRPADAFDAMGAVLGPEGNRDAEGREAGSMRGARLCTLPTDRPAAASARAVGDPVLLRATEVAGQAECTGPVAAPERVEAGIGDAPASDRADPALPRAAFRPADEGALPLGRAWSPIPHAPAAALRPRDRRAKPARRPVRDRPRDTRRRGHGLRGMRLAEGGRRRRAPP